MHRLRRQPQSGDHIVSFRNARFMSSDEFSPSGGGSLIMGHLDLRPKNMLFVEFWQTDMWTVQLRTPRASYRLTGEEDIELLRALCVAAGLRDNGDDSYSSAHAEAGT